jgi:hypothetical protein
LNSYLKYLLPTIVLVVSVTAASGQGFDTGRPDGHAPIGVMGDHTHERGEVMLSYRYMRMDMEGNRDGTDDVSVSEILSPQGRDFRVTPTAMQMNMHMFGLMYAVTDEFTLMGMLPIISTHMDHETRPGGTFRTESGGIGDVSVTALYKVADLDRQRVHVNFGLRLPSGSIEERDVTPASAPAETRLPYPMQLGSGTVDLTPGLTYLAQEDRWSGGAQLLATIRLGNNDADYRLGNRLMGTAWAAANLLERLSVSARLLGERWGNIDGSDASFDGAVAMRMVPTVFPELRAGSRVDIGLGFNVLLGGDRPSQARLAFEVLAPVYQKLDGPQLETDYQLVTGLQYVF